jgi:diguanylate cyclase (GGDEF)-like protein
MSKADKPHKSPTTVKRTLVGELLLTHLVFAAAVSMIAVGCVWWLTSWVVRDNLNEWASRWIMEVESLGDGLYLQGADQGYLEINSYLTRFPEILYVRFYDTQGKTLYVEQSQEQEPVYNPLTTQHFQQLHSRVATSQPSLLDTSALPRVRISQAVVTERIDASFDLLSAMHMDDLTTEATVVGFVELGLDYGKYDRNLANSLGYAVGLVALAALLLMLGGRVALRRAVEPLVQLQAPLGSIAEGNLDIDVPHSSYKEIDAIGRALSVAADKIRHRDNNLRRLANFDTLTGLANRHHFLTQLRDSLQSLETQKGRGALLFIDLDQFKYVNDSFGHQAGDAVLAQVSSRLRQSIRKQDLLARYSGDEFVIFIADVSMIRADEIALQLIQDLREYPLSYRSHSLNVSCSVGITEVPYPCVFTPEELISQADLACRRAKSQGRNRTEHFSAEQSELDAIRNDVEWQQRLKHALKNNDFRLHFQPIMNIRDQSIKHYEVLVRLEDNGELQYPDSFLPAAVRFGLMQEIDQWVIAESIKYLANARKHQPDLRFSINVTGSAFGDGSLPDYITHHLELHDLPAQAIILEITEQVAVGSFSQAVPQIEQLMKQGCEFAVDDFGTGYSSLSYLKKLPVQYIKIDGVFIQKLVSSRADQTIVRAISDIARIMGKETIAEFVSDAATLTLIQEIGIDYAQGYHVGKPSATLLTPENNADVVELRSLGEERIRK